MNTATIAIIGERIGKIWVGPGGQMLMKDSDLRVDIKGCVAVLKVVDVIDSGVVVRKKTKADYDFEEARAQAKPGEWGMKKWVTMKN